MKTFVSYDNGGFIKQIAVGLTAPVVEGMTTIEADDTVGMGTHYVADEAPIAYTDQQNELRKNRPSRGMEWSNLIMNWVDLRTLSEAKTQKRVEINQAREAEFDAPLVTPHGTFDSDPKARTSITDAVLLAQTLQSLGTPTTIDFTLYDNSTMTLDTAGMITVGLMLGQKIQAAHAKSRALKAQIEAATTKEQIDAITWPKQS